MHFSRPSGQRLSWCRPWKRGAVGIFSKGYCSVTTFLNMVRKVTPNPATGSQNCSFNVAMSSDLLADVGGRRTLVEHERSGGTLDGASGRHRRHGVAARERVGRLLLGRRGLLALLLLLALAEEEEHQEQRGQDADADEEVLPVDAALERDRADGGHGDDPDQG